jgi:hypothetical protein
VTSDLASVAISAVLTVAAAGQGGEHAIELMVGGQGVAGLGDHAVTAILDAPLAVALCDDAAAIGKCFDGSTQERMAVGERLFAALFRDEVADLWARIEQHAGPGHPLRLRVDVRPGRLRTLPWELLRSERDWLFRQKNVSVWRGPEPQPLAEAADVGPLRVLLVVCNPLDQQILAEEELAVITGGLAGRLGQTFVEILDGPSRDQLSAGIDRLRPHVLHFIGHGMPRVGASAEIAFNWVPGQPVAQAGMPGWELASTEVSDLADWAPRLVVINACRTAGVPQDPVGGFAEAFLAAGARAVVSMQADIQSPAAVLFSAEFYQRLGSRAPLDEIVTQARRRLVMISGDTGEWALPVLAASTDPAAALRISFVPEASSISHVCDRHDYGELRGFLDRTTERRNAWWALDPQAEQAPARPVLIVSGRPVEESRPGKTWFTRWCLLTCFLRGHRVTYVDLAEPLRRPGPDRGQNRNVKTKDWLDVVRVIRDGCTSDRQLEPLAVGAFDQFNASLNALVAGQGRTGGPAPPAPGPVPDEWRSFNYDRRGAQERIQQICAEFLTALRQTADGRPHVIALDNADRILPDAFDSPVYPALIRPVAEDSKSEIRLVLVASHDWLGQHLPKDDTGLLASVHLAGFEPDQYMRLARDYCHRRGLDFGKLLVIYKEFGRSYADSRTAVPVDAFADAIRGLPAVYLAGRP